MIPRSIKLSHARSLLTTIVVVGSLTACGSSVTSIVTQAMDSCIATRNSLFTSGHGADALKTPLADSTRALAMKVRYARGFQMFKSVAEGARDQVTLVCALDLMSYNRDIDVREFVQRYLKHPSPDVALNAQVIIERPIPK